jgi:hypothetical protein
MRRWSEEFDADALSFFAELSEENHAAFQLILRKRIRERDHRAGIQLLIQIEQPAVRVDDNRVARLAELAAVDVLPFRDNAYAHENAGTAPGTFVDDFRHSMNMVV